MTGPFTVFRTPHGNLVGTRAGRRYRAERHGGRWVCSVTLSGGRRILEQAWLPSELAAHDWLAAQMQRHDAAAHPTAKRILRAQS